MALPPLELFSLKKKPPCCRVASSLFWIQLLGDAGARKFPDAGDERKKIFDREAACGAADAWSTRERCEALRETRHSMSDALNTALQVMIALLSLVILIWPRVLATEVDLDANDSDQNHIF